MTMLHKAYAFNGPPSPAMNFTASFLDGLSCDVTNEFIRYTEVNRTILRLKI
jgi:hypothetical protein